MVVCYVVCDQDVHRSVHCLKMYDVSLVAALPHREQYLSPCRNYGNPDMTHSFTPRELYKMYIVYCC
jgi:hypothetical protein